MSILQPPIPDNDNAVNPWLNWSGLHGSALALAISQVIRDQQKVLMIVLETPRELELLADEIAFYCDDPSLPILNFPSWECLPYDHFSPQQDIVSERLKILNRLPSLQRGVVLTTCNNLLQRLPPSEYVQGQSFFIEQNQVLEPDDLRKQLVNANYFAVDQVVEPGEFTVRGSIIDVFPMGQAQPFRLDFYDNVVDSMRFFDPDTQRSDEPVERIDCLPAREFSLDEENIKGFRQRFRQLFDGDPRQSRIYNDVSDGSAPTGVEFYLPLFHDNLATLFDYAPNDSLWFIDHDSHTHFSTAWAEIKDRYDNAKYDIARRPLPPEHLYLAVDQADGLLKQLQRIRLHRQSQDTGWQANSKSPPIFSVDIRQSSPYQRLLDHLSENLKAGLKTLITTDSIGRREALEGVLTKHKADASGVASFSEFLQSDAPLCITVAAIDRGLYNDDLHYEIVCESQLYGEKAHRTRQRRQRQQDPESIIRSLAELHIGDPVVHIEHGVGRYLGLSNLDIGEQLTEFLTIAYRNGDKLYVPILSLNLINRFVGAEPEHAPLHQLGHDQWSKEKRKAREKAYDVATELLEIEALRHARTGTPMPVAAEEYAAFVSRFNYQETSDQERAIDEVLADMHSTTPMDRLVCGDVGFGKTEVALRATFVAVSNNQQVAVLVPTTLLAKQHYDQFVDRFAESAITIGLLSRFKTRKENDALVTGLTNGQPDIVIGTHRLLQDDIKFSRLGLLIIDEEHRFGVRQKEKIKRLRSQVDILTLTATPIPRTLNLTMAGMRAISIIATPPETRLSVKTFVRDWSEGLIREACIREIRRGGQIYFLHNNVKTIERMAEELQTLVPEAKIATGHGQMSERELERVMDDFYHQRFNLLVCTTIVESGIDIPSANTIIINRADRFGLAQLHQLRGRVGRSHHQAFAYLLVADRKLISGDARKRLDAIESLDTLGAGFALASHDLEIRGAGELLGETQSGMIDNVGFSLFSEYLKSAVRAIKNGEVPDLTPTAQHDCQIELHIPALFTEDYLANAHTRLIFYKRIAGAENQQALEELQIEATDRFGLLPDGAKNLFALTALRLRAESFGIKRINVDEDGGNVTFEDQPKIDVSQIISLIQRYPQSFKLGSPNSLKVQPLADDADSTRLQVVEDMLQHFTETAM